MYTVGFYKTLDYSVKKIFLLSIYYVPKHRTLVLEPQIDRLCPCFCYCCCLVGKSYLTFATPWTVAQQAPLSLGFLRQEYWNGLPFPSPGDLPKPRIKSRSPALQADASHLCHLGRLYFLTLFKKFVFIFGCTESLLLHAGFL